MNDQRNFNRLIARCWNFCGIMWGLMGIFWTSQGMPFEAVCSLGIAVGCFYFGNHYDSKED